MDLAALEREAALHTRLHERLKAAGVPFNGMTLTENVFHVTYSAEATAEQVATGDTIVAAFDPSLETERERRQQQNNAQYKTTELAGWQVPGKSFAMKTGTDDQTEYMKLDSSVTRLVNAGVWTNETSLTILDSKGFPQTVTVAEWASIAVGYTAFCLQSWQEFAQRRLMIAGATSLEELAAIP